MAIGEGEGAWESCVRWGGGEGGSLQNTVGGCGCGRARRAWCAAVRRAGERLVSWCLTRERAGYGEGGVGRGGGHGRNVCLF